MDRCIKHREKNFVDGECPICEKERLASTCSTDAVNRKEEMKKLAHEADITMVSQLMLLHNLSLKLFENLTSENIVAIQNNTVLMQNILTMI